MRTVADIFASGSAALCVAALIAAWAAPCPASDEAVPVADDNAEKSWVETLPERDPFWPVGYVKPDLQHEEPLESVREVEKKQVEIRQKSVWPALKVLSIAGSGTRHIAMLGDGIGIVQRGDVVELRRGGMIYRWDIVEISAKGVASRRKDVAPVGREDERIPYVETEEGL